MNVAEGHRINLGRAVLTALPQRALWWAGMRVLVVSDLHLGKSERMARRGGSLVPPYESQETLARLADLIARWDPLHVVCLGDSFDDNRAAEALPPEARTALSAMMAGRRWTWILGNHDPGPVALGGDCTDELVLDGVVFRHIAARDAQVAEVSGHYHPKAGVRGSRRAAFVTDGRRLILPAFGTYTGGLDVSDPAISGLMAPGARAILAGRTMVQVPLAACTRPAHGPPTRWARGLG
ncbi:MAG: ligase-associated DNA damage response endonuclease PdeM [Pseudomonadota bacterium]